MSKRAREALARVPLFASLSPRHLRRAAELCEEQRFMAGATIVRAGDVGDTFYVILEGEARVVSPTGRVWNHLYPGDFFGEISLLDGGPRTASVIAETPMVMLALPRRAFRSLLESEPVVAGRVLKHVAGLLRRTERALTA